MGVGALALRPLDRSIECVSDLFDVVGARQVIEAETYVGELARQEARVGEDHPAELAVALGERAVAGVLAVLCEQDEGSGVGGLGAEQDQIVRRSQCPVVMLRQVRTEESRSTAAKEKTVETTTPADS